MDDIKKILVPLDLSGVSVRVLKYALVFVRNFDAKISVIHVAEHFKASAGLSIPHISINKLEDESQASAGRKLEFLVADHVDETLSCEDIVLIGDPAEEIVKYAEDGSYDIIIMGTHGHKGLEKILLGSVAERVVRTAPCPVLTINPHKTKR